MAWATSIVAPPDGSMADYMASLDTMLEQPQSIYFPGHGGRLENAHAFVRALRAHRKMREQAVLDQVRKGRTTIPEMVAIIYRSTDPKLHGAAGLSVLAHLEDLVGKGEVVCDGPPMLGSMYRPV
ncbi:MAG: MBL fold metallo-hydrolase, partial [Pseudomonadota bacterium]